ncbi:hypothetical protein CISIN_1g040425mg, partial [Citrus sinensis]
MWNLNSTPRSEEFKFPLCWKPKHPKIPLQLFNLFNICLSFYEVKNKQPSWFTNKIERLYWEQWYVNLNVARLPKAHSNKSHHSKVVFDPGGTETLDLTQRIFD